MSITYDIKTGNHNGKSVIVDLNRIPVLRIPSQFAIGVMSSATRQAKILKHYTEMLTGQNTATGEFRNFVCSIDKHATEIGTLVVRGTKPFHINAFIDFIKQENEIIKLLSPYVLDGYKLNESPEQTTQEEIPAQSHPSDKQELNPLTGDPELDAFQLTGEDVGKLSVDDIRQIKTLMLQAEESSNLNIENNVTDVVAKGE